MQMKKLCTNPFTIPNHPPFANPFSFLIPLIWYSLLFFLFLLILSLFLSCLSKFSVIFFFDFIKKITINFIPTMMLVLVGLFNCFILKKKNHFFPFPFTGYCSTAVSKMAIWKWIHIYNMVPTRSHQFGEYRTRETVFVLVSLLSKMQKSDCFNFPFSTFDRKG